MTFDWQWLNTEIGNFLNRGDIHGSAATLIGLAEAVIRRRLQREGVQGAVVRANGLTINAEWETAPSDMAAPLLMRVYDPAYQRWFVLENDTNLGIGVRRTSYDTIAARPCHFTVVGSQLQFSPIPDQPYTVDLIYEQRITPLSADNPSNWVIAEYPDVYLYGALVQGLGLVMDHTAENQDQRLGLWSTAFNQGIAECVTAEKRKRGSMFTPAFRAFEAAAMAAPRTSFNVTTGF